MNAHNKGFTITEIIVVLAIIIILTAIAVPVYINVHNRAKVSTDYASLEILNYSTIVYARMNDIEGTDIFAGISDDDARIQKLIDEKMLSEFPDPQQEGAEFKWDISEQVWAIDGGASLD